MTRVAVKVIASYRQYARQDKICLVLSNKHTQQIRIHFNSKQIQTTNKQPTLLQSIAAQLKLRNVAHTQSHADQIKTTVS